MTPHATVYAIGAVGLGLIGLAVGDFALQWQPVPEGIPGRAALAYVSASILLAAGTLILTRRYALHGAYALAIFYGLWTAILKGPQVLMAPLQILPWLGFTEILALATAGLMLALVLDGQRHPGTMRVTKLAFGACPIVWGLSHFAYPEFTASMIPGWIPLRPFWAYATGAGHIAAGTAIVAGTLISGEVPQVLSSVAGRLARLAAVMLTAMLGMFVLLVHVTGVISDPANRPEWTMLFVATSLTGAAWIVSAVLSGRQEAPEALPPLAGRHAESAPESPVEV